MTDATDPKITADDAEGHVHLMADAEATETDDTAGHKHMAADSEQDEDDDTEGHHFL
jgi:hypothetical protein